jgi:hypothetical protein
MPKQLNVSATADDIRYGGNYGNNCAIWRAIKRLYPDDHCVNVGIRTVHIWQWDTQRPGLLSYHALCFLPIPAKQFIARRQDGKPVQPLNFSLDVNEITE